mgnify:CR=1 FL=1
MAYNEIENNFEGSFNMLLAVFLNSIGLYNVDVELKRYDKPYGELQEVVKFNLNGYDLEKSPYKFMRVFDFYLYAWDDGYQLLIKVSIN